LVYVGADRHVCELYYNFVTERWDVSDLTDLASLGGSALARTSFVNTYVTDFPGQGPTARVVYQGVASHVWELFYIASSGMWGAADLTELTGAGNAGTHTLLPLVTNFPNEGPVARLFFWDFNRRALGELFYVASDAAWRVADLTTVSGVSGTAVGGTAAAYLTDFPNQGPAARLVYTDTGGHVRELFYIASSRTWGAADLSALAGAEAGTAVPRPPEVYVTNFPNQGPTARLTYMSTDRHVRELFYIASDAVWRAADLTALTGAPPSAGAPPVGDPLATPARSAPLPDVVAYTTDFPNEGPTARLVYTSREGDVCELNYVASAATWRATVLTP
jgi:hypothetical protein